MADEKIKDRSERFKYDHDADLIDDINEELDREAEGARRLRKSQRVRERLLDRLLNGEEIDPDKTALILEVTKGMDKQEIDLQRIAISKKDSGSNAAIARALEETLRRIEEGNAPAPTGRSKRASNALDTDFLGDVSEEVKTSGELATPDTQENFDEFTQRMEDK